MLKVGYETGSTQDIDLKDGERLVGIKSKLYDNSPGNSALHCNMIFVIGTLEDLEQEPEIDVDMGELFGY